MKELIKRIWTHPKYGTAFLIVAGLLFLFVWRTFDPQSFYEKITGFIEDMKVLVEYAMVLAIVIVGLRMMFGWRPFWKKGRGRA